MKILFDFHIPFSLAHGGQQVQIEQTKAALGRSGVDVDWMRWWDDSQEADIIHFFGLPSKSYAQFARQKNIKLVSSVLLGGLGARSSFKRALQKIAIGAIRRFSPAGVSARMGWEGWKVADAYVGLTEWEGKLMNEIFEVPRNKIHIVPNGVEDLFLAGRPSTRGKWLVTTGSILPVKRLVETAKSAVVAKVPYWVIGRPFSEADQYYRDFASLARNHPDFIRYEGPIMDRAQIAQIYREARGFVLFSKWESLSLSALEASACGCPLLLSDMPWARSTFGSLAKYCDITKPIEEIASQLREFYDMCKGRTNCAAGAG